MRTIDFAAHYEALGLEPGASDPEIARAKRVCNELYHSDRLAHMSTDAQAIAAEKVRAANEAAHTLLDPSLRAARDQWIVEWRARGSTGFSPQDPGPSATARPRPSTPAPNPPRPGSSPLVRLVLASSAVGALIGAGVFLMQHGRGAGSAASAARSAPDTTRPAPPASQPAAPSRPVPRRVVDSMITLQADGGWTARVATGGSAWRASFIPESDNVMYRVRINGTREYVLNSEPGFRHTSEEAQSYEFSSLTGHPVRIRYTRWPRSSARGTLVHTRSIELSGTGDWSQRVWLGPFGFRWDVDRAVAYEVRDDEGRISRVPPSVQSVAFGRTPVWIRFRSIDSLPLSLTFYYTVR